jgi:caffeoyl-CoA O-methyltransferase
MINIVHPDIATYIEAHTQAESELLQELKAYTYQHLDYPEKLSGLTTGRLLKLLVQISRATQVLEIGMFTGYATLSMAEGLPEHGRIMTCETNPRAIDVAKSFFERSPHGNKISVHFTKADDFINTLDTTFDLIFIDADKRGYLHYYEACLPKLNAGGLMVIDNVLWSGYVLAPRDAKDQVLIDLNTHIKNDVRVENLLLSDRDGIQIIRKK